MKRIFTALLLLLAISFQGNAQSLLTNQCESSPCNALPICGNNITQPNSFTSTAMPQGTPLNVTTCLSFSPNTTYTYGANWVYYRFTCYTTGVLNFTITANDALSDLDWAVWDITTSACGNLNTGNVVECNAGLAGPTGIVGTGAPLFEPSITVVAGNTYILGVSRASNGTVTTGFNIDFTGTTASLVDNVAPTLASIVPINACNSVNSVQVKLSERVRCSQIQTSDFALTGPSTTISTATGNGCNGCTNSPATQVNYSNLSDTITLTFPTALAAGNYTIALTSPNAAQPFFDFCGNVANITPTLSFTVANPLSDSIHVGFNCSTLLYTDTVWGYYGTSPYQYKILSPTGTAPFNGVYGAATPSYNIFTGLSGGVSYTVTIKDANGCEMSTVITPTVYTPLQTPNTSVLNSASPPCFNQFALDSIYINPVGNGGIPPYTLTLGVPAGATAGTYTAPNKWNGLSFTTVATYTITVTDNAGCTKSALKTLVNPPALVFNSLTSTNPLCFGDPSGTISANISGGTGTITYTISPYNNPPVTITGATPKIFNNVIAGLYTITGTDANGCTITSSITVTSNPQIVIKTTNSPLPITYNNPVCSNPCGGWIKGSATGGVGTKKFYLYNSTMTSFVDSSTNITTPVLGTFSNLCQGTYTVMCKDAAGCTATATYTLALPPIPDIVFDSINNVACFGGCSGKIFTTTTGGTSPFTYAITPSNNPPCGAATAGTGVNLGDYSNLPIGTYKIVVTSTAAATLGGGCKDSVQNIAITQPATGVSATSLVGLNVSCNGLCDGTGTITPGGGTPSAGGIYSYQIQSGPGVSATINATGTAGNLTGLCAGTYVIKVTDANICNTTVSIVITQPPVLAANSVVLTNVSCNGLCDGKDSIHVVGGTKPYSYIISGAGSPVIALNTDSTAKATGLCNGTYTVTITDAHLCVATVTLTISQPSVLGVTAVQDSVDCFGTTTGGITVTATGGTSPYQYSKDNCLTYQSSNIFTNLGVGTYTICVKDFHGCTSTVTINVLQPTLLGVTAVQDSVDCFGTNTGGITVTATGGTSPYQYSKDNCLTYQSSNIFTNIGFGTYTICVKDFHGCTSTVTINVLQPTLLGVTAVQDSVDCFGTTTGGITVTATGGTSPYQYSKDNCLTYQSSNIFTNIGFGTYTICVKDFHGCTSTVTINVLQPTVLGVTAVQDSVDCFGTNTGGITVTATGGTSPYQYSKDNCLTYQSSNTFTNIGVGTYTICVKDFHGCTSTVTINVLQPTAVNITGITSTVATCTPGNDGTATVTVTGGTSPYQYQDGLNPLQSSNILTGLSVGSHLITVTDYHGCTDTMTVIINTANGPSFTVVIDSVDCFGTNTGGITVAATGGTSPYQYSKDGCLTYQVSPIFPTLVAGSYTICVKDANSCTITSNVVVNEPTVLGVTAVQDSVDCFGTTTGGITVTATGGTSPYQYSKDNCLTYQSSNIFTNIGFGTYTICVKDFHGCTSTVTINVLQPTLLGVTAVQDSVDCFGTTTGGITVTATGGTSPYQYSKDNCLTYQSSNIFTNIGFGTYTICVKDFHGCTSTVTINVLQPTVLGVTAVQDSVDCFGTNTGGITVTATGGTSPYQYSKDNCLTYQSSNTFTNIGVGTYTICVKDFHGCTSTVTINVLQPTAVNITGITSTVATCTPGNDGTATVTVTGGTSPYQYQDGLNPLQSSNILTGLSVGSHLITVTDYHGCTDTMTVIINTANGPSFTVVIDSVDCFGTNTGGITVAATGGTSPYQYSKDGCLTYQVSPIFPTLVAGSYTICVKDANSCTITSNVVVNEPTVLGVTAVQDSVDCFGTTTGGITVTATGGTSPYQYSKDNCLTYQSSNIFTNIGFGTYTICVKDFHGCTSTVTINVLQPTLLGVTAVQDSVDCFGTTTGGITVTATGGTSPYQYSKDNCLTYQSSNIFTNIGFGTYTICVKDFHGCTSTVTINVLQPTVLGVTAVQDSVDCFGTNTGGITVTATGGTSPYQYSKDNCLTYQSSNTFTNIGVGTYTICVKDFHGCTSTVTINVLQPTAVNITGITSTVATCTPGNDGTATVTVTGGTSPYQYQDGLNPLQSSNILTGLSVGSHLITVTDYHGCTDTMTVIINTANGPSFTVVIDSVDCFGTNTGGITVAATGGTSPYQYSKDGCLTYQVSPIFPTLVAGSYTICVKDANSCTITSNVVVNEPTVLGVTAVQDSVDCFGTTTGGITVTATGGTSPYQYSKDNCLTYQSSNIFTNIGFGTYTICVKDFHGCTSTVTINVLQPTLLGVTAVQDSVDCFGTTTGGITVTATGGTSPYQYSKDNCLTYQSSNIFTNIGFGTYTICVKDFHGCTSTVTINVLQPTVLGVTAVQDSVDCFGTNTGGITVTATGGTSPYQYSKDNCLTYQSSNTFTNIGVGTYTICVKDFHGCTSTVTINVLQPTAVNITGITSTVATCTPGNDGTATVTVTGGTSPYQYQDGLNPLQSSNILTGLSVGSHLITVTDYHGCTDTMTVIINTANGPVISITSQTSPTCSPGCDGTASVSVVGGMTPYNISISTPVGLTCVVTQPSFGNFANLGIGIYTVSVIDANSCTNATTFELVLPSGTPIDTLSTTLASCSPGNDGTATMTPTTGVTFTINPAVIPAIVGNVISGLASNTLYTVTGTNLNGCTSTTSFQIGVNGSTPIDTLSTTLASCSPGNDGTATMTPTTGVTFTVSPVGPTATGNVISGLAANTLYTVTGTNLNGCTSTTSFQIGVNGSTPIDTLSTILASCSPGNDGTATMTPTTGVTFTINPAVIPAIVGNVISGLASNTLYTVTGTNLNGCTSTTSFQIGVNGSTPIDTLSTTLASCSPGCDGTATMTPSIGMTFTVNPAVLPAIVGNVISGLCANTLYTVTGTNANGCTSTKSFQIGVNGLTPIDTLSTTLASCSPGNDGTATMTPTTGVTFTINPAVIPAIVGNVISGLAANTLYTVTGTNANGCTSTTSFQIGTNGSTPIDTLSTTLASCSPGCDGTATMTPSIGMTFTVNPAVLPAIVGNVISGLCANTLYTVTGTNANGCTSTTSFQIGTTAPPTVSVTAFTNCTGTGSNNGTITVVGAGGTPGYTYTITPNSGTQLPVGTWTGLPCGVTYVITCTDTKGCTGTVTQTISEPGLVGCSAIKTDEICFGACNGTITASGSGGVGSFTYSISPGTINATTGIAINLCPGTYTVTATDGNNFAAITSVTINAGASISFTAPTIAAPSCVPGCDGSITISATSSTPVQSGTITYAFTPPAGTTCNVQQPTSGNFINVGTGAYVITATDVNGCTTSTTVNMAPNGGPVINNVTVTNVSCNAACDGIIDINANNAAQYSIDNGTTNQVSSTFNNVCAGTYSVVVTSANGCTAASTTIVTEPPALVFTNPSTITNPACFGGSTGSIVVAATGGNGPIIFTYSPQPVGSTQTPSGSFNNLPSGTYIITATDGVCTSTTSITLVDPAQLIWSTATSTNITCFGAANGTITAIASGGTGPIIYSYNPAIPGSLSAITSSGIYQVIATDGNNCSINTSFTITEPTAITLSAPTLTHNLCFGDNAGTISITANGGTQPYTFTLSPNNGSQPTSGNFINLPAATYTITVTDANGCTLTTTAIITQPQSGVQFNTPINVQNVACFGQNTGAITAVALGGTPNYTYTLNGGAPQGNGSFTNLFAGNYTITAADVNGCSISTVVTVTQNPAIVITAIAITEPICHGDANGALTITNGGGVSPYQYSLDGPPYQSSGTFTGLIAKSYLVEIKDALGCVKDTNVVVTEPDAVGAKLLVTDATCVDSKDGKILVQGTGGRGGYKYYVTPGLHVNKSGVFAGLEVGTYTLRVVDTAGCEYSTTFIINPPSNPIQNTITKQDLGCTGVGNEGTAKANVSGGTPPYVYMWFTNPVQTTQTATGLYFGMYEMQVTDADGCMVKDTIQIEAGPCCDVSFIPNAFSPNGDGNNDVFRVLTTAGIQLQQLEIFDRWGNKVWSTNDYRRGWDGMINGAPAQIETYQYVFRYICLTDNKTYIKKGDVMLVR